MINYVQYFFGFSQKEASPLTNKTVKLYFDQAKVQFVELKLSNTQTCENLHMTNHNEIGKKIAEISTDKSEAKDKKSTIQKTDYSFYIIDEANSLSIIHLKLTDKPWSYLTLPTSSLHYLNEVHLDLKPRDKDNSDQNLVSRANIEDYIREGILSKYSNKQKKFEDRVVLLDKDQILILKKYDSQKVKVILVSDIASVKKVAKDKQFTGKYMFKITTKENDSTIFNSTNTTDMDCWIDTILNQVSLMRENMFFVNYSKEMNEIIKSVYADSTTIITNQLNTLHGVLSIKESRNLFLRFLDNPQIASLINDIINYKISIKEANYPSAKRAFVSFTKSLLIEEYNLSIYFGEGEVQQSMVADSQDNSKKKTTILYQNISIETRLIGIKDMNLPLLIKSIMPYQTLVHFKDVIAELKKIPDAQSKQLSQHLKMELFNEVFEKIVKMLKISFKEIVANRSFIVGIEALLWFYTEKRDSFSKGRALTFDCLVFNKV